MSVEASNFVAIMKQWLAAIERANEIDGMYSWKNEEDSLRQAIACAEHLEAAVAEQHEKQDGWVLREVLFSNGEPIAHREAEKHKEKNT